MKNTSGYAIGMDIGGSEKVLYFHKEENALAYMQARHDKWFKWYGECSVPVLPMFSDKDIFED